MPLTAKFCSKCGRQIIYQQIDGKLREFCPACNTVFYQNPLPVAASVILNPKREVLLVKRRNEPKKGLWCLPMGFAEIGETISQAAMRELHEETGITGKIIRLLAARSTEIEPYGDLLIITFEASKTSGTEKPGDDAEQTAYFKLDDLPEMAFEANKYAIYYSIEAHKENWAIEDSFKHTLLNTPDKKLSDTLVSLIQKNALIISENWLHDVRSNPTTSTYASVDSEHLRKRVNQALSQFSRWLSDNKADEEIRSFYLGLGRERNQMGFGPYETIGSLTILRKIIQQFAGENMARKNAVEAYKALELDHRIIAFFDRAIYFVSRGFEEKM